jgi:hydrogenase maturation protein HypF
MVSPGERRVLTSPESPIVLLQRRAGFGGIAASVAPCNPMLGAMLPYTPLHHLLLRAVGGAVVATSGNLSDEPICIDERDAVERLAGIADLFLVHDRPIVRHVDDSIVRVVLDRELVLRRARGYAPLPVPLRAPAPPLLAVGAHLKNTVAVTAGANAFISQHIGDLETPQSLAAFKDVIGSLRALYRIDPERVISDLHPDYLSTRHAKTLGVPVVQVQHHYAHVRACMADNDLDGRVLGVSWDGTGYGPDGTVWGGEFLLTGDAGYDRIATLRAFRLPGGDRAVREPRRAALGLLHALYGAAVASREDLPVATTFEPAALALLVQALERGVNAPVTTSAGRLFDAVASLTGIRQTSTFEGQAAMELEAAFDERTDDAYSFQLIDSTPIVVDWQPMVEGILADVAALAPAGVISARFHLTLAAIVAGVALRVGEPRVVLTGGCFQNRRLLEGVVRRLRDAGLRPYWHQRVPPNDGGISLGQIAAYLHERNG